MNYTITKKRILPYDFKVKGDTVTITNTRNQTLKVTRSQIVHQLQRDDIDTHRRVMYEGALIAIDRAAPGTNCSCLQYLGDNNCQVPGHQRG